MRRGGTALPLTKLVSNTWPSVGRPILVEQARFLALLARELIAAHSAPSGIAFRELPEYRRFLHGAYACGFVCRDILLSTVAYNASPQELRRADFITIRKHVHMMMRGERNACCGFDFEESDEGGGWVYGAVESGALEAIAARLDELTWSTPA